MRHFRIGEQLFLLSITALYLAFAYPSHAYTPLASPLPAESTDPVVMLKIQQVAFVMTEPTKWESDEVYAKSPSIIRTTPLGKSISEKVTHGLASLEGRKNNTSPDIPMDLTVTAIRNEDGNFVIHLVATLKNSLDETVAKVDATQYSVNGGGTYFVLPVLPKTGQGDLITLKIVPVLLTEK